MNQQVVTQPSSVPGDLLMSDEHFAILQKYRPQDERKVEIWARGSGWHLPEKEGLGAVIDLPEFGARFTLAALYKGTPLGG